MTQRFYRQCVGLLGMLAVLVVPIQGCSPETQSAVLPTGTRRMIWIDLSSSVSEPQRRGWLHEAETIIKGLAGGDSIAVYGVHEATLGAAPLYAGDLPAVPPDAPLSVQIEVPKIQRTVREKTRAVVTQALTGRDNAPRTDLCGLRHEVARVAVMTSLGRT